jgi:hypothetical protein
LQGRSAHRKSHLQQVGEAFSVASKSQAGKKLRHSAGKGFDGAQKCRQLWQRRQQAVYALQTFADFGSGDGGFLSLQSV